jgi:hypothetical protein
MERFRLEVFTSRFPKLPFFHHSAKRSGEKGKNGGDQSESTTKGDAQKNQLHDACEVPHHRLEQTTDRTQTAVGRTTSTLSDPSSPLASVIQEFQQLIEGDWKLFMLFHQMFDQIPKMAPFDKDPTGKSQVSRFVYYSTLIFYSIL